MKIREENPYSAVTLLKVKQEEERATKQHETQKKAQIQTDFIKVDDKMRRLYNKTEQMFKDIDDAVQTFNCQVDRVRIDLNKALDKFKGESKKLKEQIRSKTAEFPNLEEMQKELKQAMLQLEILVPATKR